MNVKLQFEIISQKMKPFLDNFIIFYFTITRLKLTSSGEDKSACDRRGSKRPWEFCQAGCRPSRRTPWPGGTAADDALTPTRRRPRLVIPVIAGEERGLSGWLTLISRLDEEERLRVISGISVKSPVRNRLGEQVKKLVSLLICFCITIIESRNNRCFLWRSQNAPVCQEAPKVQRFPKSRVLHLNGCQQRWGRVSSSLFVLLLRFFL